MIKVEELVKSSEVDVKSEPSADNLNEQVESEQPPQKKSKIEHKTIKNEIKKQIVT